MTCPRCHGSGGREGSPCERCKGSGRSAEHQCPGKLARGLEPFLTTYAVWHAHGILPAAGGWLDQSPWWVDAVMVLGAERGLIEEGKRPTRGGTGPRPGSDGEPMLIKKGPDGEPPPGFAKL